MISILVPIFGVEKYIERCARSLLEQTYPDIEYVFVDDCSPDASVAILQKIIPEYPNREKYVKLLRHDKNRGLAAARNTAVEASTGDYLMHVDSDDFLEKDSVSVLMDRVQKHSSDVLIFGYYVVKANQIKKTHPSFTNRVDYIKSILTHRQAGVVWNKVYNSSFYKNSGIHSIEGINHGEDYVVTPRLIYKASVIDVLDKCLYYYNQDNASSYSNKIKRQSIESLRHADSILRDFFLNIPDAYLYKEDINIAEMRSVLYLIKIAEMSTYPLISELYSETLRRTDLKLSYSDKILLYLFNNRHYGVIEKLIKIYNKLML